MTGVEHRVSHDDLLSPELHDIIARAHWQTAKSVEHVEGGQHAYNVIGTSKDDLTNEEFWLVAKAIRLLGRDEVWTPPEGFFDDPSKRRPMKNTYLYVGDYAYWFTKGYRSKPMLNREHISVQAKTPTRQVVQDRLSGEAPEPRAVSPERLPRRPLTEETDAQLKLL